MAVKIKQARGDVYLANQQNLPTGQLFWSYVWNDAKKAKGKKRSYSEGQLWIKDPSSRELTEVANKRSVNAATFRGFIEEDFNGNFAEANEETQHYLQHPHIGDFWIFNFKYDKNNTDDTHQFKYSFNKGDCLLVTKTSYVKEGSVYRDKIDSVEYIRIPGGVVDTEGSSLEASTVVDAVAELEQRLLYKGEFNSFKEFVNLPKGKGWLYVSKEYIRVAKEFLLIPNKEYTEEKYVTIRKGDFVYWNGAIWVHIRSGLLPSDLPYKPESSKIDEIVSFDEFHKNLLKNVTNLKEAIDILFSQKAGLDKDGKIPYDALPTSVVNSMVLQGVWHPLKDNNPALANQEKYQQPWPAPIDIEGKVLDTYKSGWFWIVDTDGITNVQYVDKTIPGRVLELNRGDFIVWVGNIKNTDNTVGRFEIIDNSDRVSAIEVFQEYNKETTKITLLGNVGFQVRDDTKKVTVGVEKNVITINTSRLVGLSQNQYGVKNYLPIYTSASELGVSDLHEVPASGDIPTTLVSDVSFQVGELTRDRSSDFYGEVTVHATNEAVGVSGRGNNAYVIDASILTLENKSFTRITKMETSVRNRFIPTGLLADLQETLHITMPDASATVVGILHNSKIPTSTDPNRRLSDTLTENYITKTFKDGFITDTLTSETFFKDSVLEENSEEGLQNIGIGRTVVEDMDTGEITFWAKTKDSAEGFYTGYHIKETGSIIANRIEHFLNRSSKGKTHIRINPTVLKQDIENYIHLPMEDGTLLLWEDWTAHINGHGVPLMIPAWEDMQWDGKKFVGLDTSPITIKLNRTATGDTVQDRVNDLLEDMGPGTKSTWSYIKSNRAGSEINNQRCPNSEDIQKPEAKDDVVTIDAWLETQRAVATKEAFILPSSTLADGDSKMDPHTLEVVQDEKEIPVDYGKKSRGGLFQRILPSRTLYPNDEQYYDWHTGEKIPQQSLRKDVEMPAYGGVLLTSKSPILGGYWGEKV